MTKLVQTALLVSLLLSAQYVYVRCVGPPPDPEPECPNCPKGPGEYDGYPFGHGDYYGLPPWLVSALKGREGRPGRDGEKGIKGCKGEKGDTGNPGEVGEKGLPGERGDKGEMGAKV